ncbi:hypothetical protein L6R21_00790 [bacterium]|nr:hypothetical protein [bacterium]
MNHTLLRQHIQQFIRASKKDPQEFNQHLKDRLDFTAYYQQFTRDRILAMTPEEIYEYISKLWAMLIWGNKHYVVDKIIEDNGLANLRKNLANLVWGEADIAERWDIFRSEIKGIGPAMISEILCKTHPNEFMLWNRRAYVGLHYLSISKLPRYDYQLTGDVYSSLCQVCKEIAQELKSAGFGDTTLLAVDYFIWFELQVEENLSKIHSKRDNDEVTEVEPAETSKFIHDDIRDKLRDIGQWLGFTAKIEQKVSEGSKVDTIWEATIGNMGRVIYVFEVQTKGSIDSLILNLLKSLNNPAVQGVVAVSDKQQIEKIKNYVQDVKDLRDKLRYWDYEEISRVHESLEQVNWSINNLGLVPQGF